MKAAVFGNGVEIRVVEAVEPGIEAALAHQLAMGAGLDHPTVGLIKAQNRPIAGGAESERAGEIDHRPRCRRAQQRLATSSLFAAIFRPCRVEIA